MMRIGWLLIFKPSVFQFHMKIYPIPNLYSALTLINQEPRRWFKQRNLTLEGTHNDMRKSSFQQRIIIRLSKLNDNLHKL